MWYCLSSVRMSRGLLLPAELALLAKAESSSRKARAATEDLRQA